MKKLTKLSLKSMAVLLGASLIFCAPDLSQTVSYATEKATSSAEDGTETSPLTVL